MVGILTVISMINTTSERLKARNFFICQYFTFYEQLKFRAQLSCRARKKFYDLGVRMAIIKIIKKTFSMREAGVCVINNHTPLRTSRSSSVSFNAATLTMK